VSKPKNKLKQFYHNGDDRHYSVACKSQPGTSSRTEKDPFLVLEGNNYQFITIMGGDDCFNRIQANRFLGPAHLFFN
jgi:hypothetical protein